MGTNLLFSTGSGSCYPVVMVKNLVPSWQILEVLQLQPQKNIQSNRICVSVRIVGLSHVWARQCTSTLRLRGGWVFGSRDTWFYALMLLSADTMNILHQRTRLSSLSKQGSNWQHQLRQASLYLWHIMTSALRRD